MCLCARVYVYMGVHARTISRGVDTSIHTVTTRIRARTVSHVLRATVPRRDTQVTDTALQSYNKQAVRQRTLVA